mmetsp:Transcript_116782/g.371671  ORF Transcript_116782/g.371671 Transcript_116782/m.371671 type:complete len:433 (+) Transcript_116782:82-1380(+)
MARQGLPLVAVAAGAVAGGVLLGVALERLRAGRAGRRKGGVSSSEVVKSGADVFVDRRALERLVARCVELCGASEANAALVAQVLVAADCRGVPSHGVNRAEMYCGELRARLIDAAAAPQVVAGSETASVATVDGNNGLGAVVSKFAMELCIKKAKATGIGLVVCRRSNHFGIAGFWPEMALREGLIGFAFTNTSPFMVPTRACQRAGGTNPIAFYCPAGEDSFQLDMATTTVPVGKVEVCHRKQQEMPHGWGVDHTGTRSTTNPAEVLNRGGLTPLGGLEETAGYKGYGLNMMVEILCGVLSGCGNVGPDVPPWRVDRSGPVDYGHCFLCIDPKKLLPEEGRFEGSLAAYLARMRSLQAADASLPVLVPGDPEKGEERLVGVQGVRLNRNVALGLRALARDLGCQADLPASLSALPEDASVPRAVGTSRTP